MFKSLLVLVTFTQTQGVVFVISHEFVIWKRFILYSLVKDASIASTDGNVFGNSSIF